MVDEEFLMKFLMGDVLWCFGSLQREEVVDGRGREWGKKEGLL